ncbi:aminopeptidase [Sinomicrobium pectinilyticum]|uniref:Aminopeptidase n=1 Tax=Sinomicrobium pectinilyticum TaxID=1084421 RepID=A0A3N0DRP9_SINP1|nr:M1 family aminopeptidase [Sinomicrobium pectinilyticum]RNL78156.1 aminopeptidase [Sinomicrobium pectinilyticum]
MKQIFFFDLRSYFHRYITYIVVIALLCMGIFAGSRFNLSVGEEVYLNSPYTIGFMVAMLSISVIFIATVLALQLLFKEGDSRFDAVLFTTPVSRKSFVLGRFFSFFTLTFGCFALLVLGFASGQNFHDGMEMQSHTQTGSYLYPFVVFGLVNALFTCSVLYAVAWITHRKLPVVSAGLMLYIFYLVILLFSNSPFMAGSMPQSVFAQQISALTDPFGLSAYFYEARDFTVSRRNTNLVPLTGYFLINRVLFTGVSFLFIIIGCKYFSFSAKRNGALKQRRLKSVEKNGGAENTSFVVASPAFGTLALLRSAGSFMKKDLTYLFKSITLVAVSVLLLFYVGMEIYAEIEGGIRLPQKYAGSGLMVSVISENFHFLGLLIVAYFVNDLFWRSRISGFYDIENSTFFARTKLAGHWLSCSTLLLFFSVLLLLQGLIFQYSYGYFHIDGQAYTGVFVFNTFPLILFAGAALLINDRIRNRYLALGVSLLLILLITGPVSQKLIRQPLLRFFAGHTLPYSDFNGYGVYLSSFLLRLLFGLCVIGLLWLINSSIKYRKINMPIILCCVVLAGTAFFSGKKFTEGYLPVNKTDMLQTAARYEQEYRKYQFVPQPVITDVKTRIALYPDQNAYAVTGQYVLKNKTDESIHKILLNFHPDLKVEKAVFRASGRDKIISEKITGLVLQEPLLPGDSATLHFELACKWYPVNGHRSFNAIIENGSFMRISRYYPRIGYQPDHEITDKNERKRYGLGEATAVKRLNAPKIHNDFIHLDMTISTTADQVAVGTGELIREWQEDDRNHFHYKTKEAIPFRFAVSSGVYTGKTVEYEGIRIRVLYHPRHYENTAHLIDNIKNTLDYCISNFGAFPFQSVTFAEVSSFTKGFAATAYPAVIFMTEDMVFHANIKADRQQDVINELAGHELSHLWWGNNRIAPDDREGAPMLTETLAMYTEMMLYKKMHGREKMMERVKMHRQIYNAEKGFAPPQPLYKVTGENIHISYSKGAVVMVALSELIGEHNVNKALKEFLRKHCYPQEAPVSTDLINEFLKVSDKKYHGKIKTLFEKNN